MDNKPLKYIPLAFKALALISAALGLVFFVIILIGGGTPDAPRVTSVLALILGFFYLLFFWTIAEVIGLLIKIESNTRR
ncbi:MAG TPA: hypothetical protein PKB12_02015 [Elusimicrobiota bacterium]|jgi:hypothetical protein|nr:hypothetical protein [Elusimicrobiota bacterium]HMX42475.1 hypothetical protein [Elusimicrobiota bacterium]HMZ27520.1 hypothetical protein [Elusimicrobiota bacterium]HNA59497.1 hypothetical protein [Elusimicrobiota bacterium]HNC74651.1 hypothetical protein [Elusimicrobiota bacterium]